MLSKKDAKNLDTKKQKSVEAGPTEIRNSYCIWIT